MNLDSRTYKVSPLVADIHDMILHAYDSDLFEIKLCSCSIAIGLPTILVSHFIKKNH